ncbi:metal-dependent hydrolase [Blattabacterium sp. (Cryptocercus kyebangensis)]|uniref:metal-dependent hydrolase n=1 Tax=Blattabacterium sp. (Cryptocercus kyebangensis) TaxID=298656 RepID=UPI000D7CD59B|nr:metal-dependent hydrolase [Blattabacterium sp. (Cryptocercus kyebangensis)]AWU43703.1 metal-dependent hydrolase [Blattabacterium sp. (Cryptocercus kyebangensis)]
MKITFFTHSTCMLEIHKNFLLIDPFFSENPILEKRTLLSNKYIQSFERIDYILLTHAHYDHVCDVEFFAKKFNSLIISNYEISNFFNKKGLKTYGINYGSFISFPFGKLKYVWASHSSSFNDGTYGGNPGGFLLHTDKGNIYLSGDTSLTYEMNLIPKFGNLKISILPIGGIYTMDVEEAIIASNFLQCDKILGVHYDTFESIKIDRKKAKEKFLDKKKQLFLLEMGESICI